MILVVDTSTLREAKTIVTEPFTAFDISTDGLRAFTIGNDRMLRAVSFDQGKGTASLGGVASLPDAIYVAPNATG